ncbi:MAG: efflux RND transporter periplasmic adaptor subunit [Alphaproteobacteria bacterium]|nr:efflux RND transporter periplasmic adaptor subunit [Alphaproteobacteria bacterium]MBQ8557894.1 efflux RND transporter periplasmic adaptor subunit [Alphaproteobacteria bacterium]
MKKNWSEKVKKYKKALLCCVVVVFVGCGVYYGYKYFYTKSTGQMPIQQVSAIKVSATEIYPETSFVAKIESKDKVGLRARVQGFLQQQLFQEGDLVKENQPLFIIEPVNFEARVREATANVAKAEAQVKNTKAQFDRTTKLFKTKDVSEAKLDEAEAAYSSAEASLAQAKAQLDLAQKDLEYTTIVSPMDGKIGESKYSVGELIGPSSGVLAVVVRINPIEAVFSVSENQLLNMQKNFQKSDKVLVEFIKSDGEKYNHSGSINFIDVALDEAMNTLKIKASFPNADGELIAGQYGRIVLKSLTPRPEIVIPQRAVQQDMTGTYVYILTPDDKVERRDVVRGDELPNFEVVIDKGLNVGDVVVTEGFQKIAPQMTVKPIFETEQTNLQVQ